MVTVLTGAHFTVPQTGKVIKLVSRDCCPYLDDYEPTERSIAALAVASIRPDVIEQRLGAVTCEGRDDTQSGWGEPWYH